VTAVSAAANIAPERPRIVVFDEQRLLGEALSALIEHDGAFEVITVVTEESAIAGELLRESPELLVLSLCPGGEDCLGALVGVVDADSPTRIIVLAERIDPDTVTLCLNAGVRALLVKSDDGECILSALWQVLSDHLVFPAGWRAALSTPESSSSLTALSDRQLEVLKLAIGGRSNREIASQLYISVNTVKFHLRSTFKVLGVRNRVDAARRYSGLGRVA
jgi:two-component system, NarL family, nitrate/nitrite response regulator NarP